MREPESSEIAGERVHCAALRMALPVALMLLVVKLLKVWMSLVVFQRWPGYGGEWILRVVTGSVTFRFFLLALGVYWPWKRIAPPRWRWLFPLPAALLLLAVKIGSALVRGTPPGLSHLIATWTGEIHFLAATFARDAGFVCLYFCLIHLALLAAGRAFQGHARALFMGFTVSLLLLAGADLGYFIRTGQNGTSQAMFFLLKNVRSLAPLVAGEFSTSSVAALCSGPLLFFVSWRYLKLHPPRLAERWRRLVILVPMAAGLFLLSPFAPTLENPKYGRFSRDVFDGMVRDVVADPCFEADKSAREELASTGRPSWESSSLRLAGAGKDLPNVVIVMVESLRARSTSLHNPALGTTPFLVELSRHAAVVERMHAVIPRTSSAWIGILYGMYPISDIAAQAWVTRQYADPRPKSLPELLKPYGYASAFFLATHLEIDNERDIVANLRFDTVRSEEDFRREGAVRVNTMGVADDVMLKPIGEWVAGQRAAKRPFLLTVMTNVGHAPYQPPPSWRRRILASGGNQLLNDSLNCVSYSDDFLRRLFPIVAGGGLADSTIFVVLGDHGQGFGEHQSYGMRTLHEECLHIPTVIYAPRFKEHPVVVRGPRQQIDLLPTLADLMGLRLEGGRLPGVSLLREQAEERPLYFMGSIDDSFLALTRGSRKWIYHFDRTPVEAYDLATDPGEQHPAYRDGGDPAVRGAVRDMTLWRERSRLSLIAAPPRR
ncbi:sulfatase-like hydrolase/transferase [Geomonas sp. Red32]|uniref:LTA synthase family protein n=1 Tax=Geomonas sp. Red32 TaxID=2912856 RepID=UPI00202CCEA9|nr:sulfatase-like hydrolase/transferase [Geomonas sp. Red32]MCM0082265.1 sulfatase-like hydrolase/transferase [Geomonas sp. Red32]